MVIYPARDGVISEYATFTAQRTVIVPDEYCLMPHTPNRHLKVSEKKFVLLSLIFTV